jgi:hypothetical protein
MQICCHFGFPYVIAGLSGQNGLEILTNRSDGVAGSLRRGSSAGADEQVRAAL